MDAKKRVNMAPPTTADEKKKALATALTNIEKQFGKGAVMRLGQNTAMNVAAISTGSLSLDMALGIGGVPRGRIVEIYGPESSGKTTVALHIIAQAQKAGGNAAFIDAEHALDPIYAKALGVDVDSLLVSQPDTGEQALEIAEALVRSGAIDVIVVDSVAALVPRAEIEGEMGDSHVGLQARLMSQALRKLAGALSKFNCVAVFINQLREKVGIVYGNPEVTTGGRALKFYSSVRLDVRRKESLKNGDEVIGTRTRVKVVKNKVAPPFKIAEFDIMYGTGISHVGEVLDMAVEHDIIHKSGSWFSYQDRRLGQGRDNVKTVLKEDPALADEIERQVREAVAKENGAQDETAAAAAKSAAKQPPAQKDDEAFDSIDNLLADDDSDEDGKPAARRGASIDVEADDLLSTEITEVRLLKNGRYGLFSGKTFLFSLGGAALLDTGVGKGDRLDDGELETLRARAAEDRAREKALRLLDQRDHAKVELTRKIARTEGEKAAQAAAEAMERAGLVDDAAFARRYADELFGRKLFGRRRVEYELCRRGVAHALAEQTSRELDRAPVDRAAAFLRRKYPRALQDERERRRALAALNRAGYDWETARDALRVDEG